MELTSVVQVHISVVGNDKMRISWITENQTPAIVKYGTSLRIYEFAANGTISSYHLVMYLHEVVISPLKPNTIYYYLCGQDLNPEFNLKTPPAQFPINFTVVGDLGQIDWPTSTLDHIAKSNYHMLLLLGDLSYIHRPWMVTQGNHDVEKVPKSGSYFNLYYSFEVAGVHVMMLGSYVDFDASSIQYMWLQTDLRGFNRRRTSWVMVLLYAPWYNSNYAYQLELESVQIKETMEEMIYGARADVVFVRHVHAYERFKDKANKFGPAYGPAYITIGDGGNREGLASLNTDDDIETILVGSHCIWTSSTYLLVNRRASSPHKIEG
ncbi:putative purple acid phosphatase 20 [Camellia lanceoleosa]|uniref:Purple acid phosphatase 20 n=1 Tax=Camellia lanceoleosa TaxID=1840588 RepID=A0ACC0HUA7_9ERIC|nr:putative purple acid phosphatase 20 [Camellia lanceoleosa]